ncbi:MAG: gamma-glutamyltranspeptidase, partial [Ilumatobacter sp.]|nr:gamma-glutamyltranspeptidase [Ilumatobacter sp.]
GMPVVELEGHSPESWRALERRGHRIATKPAFDSGFGHAHAITLSDGVLVGAADPRARVAAVIGR